jgi:beta-aspartyl-peptidase (threonine type)
MSAMKRGSSLDGVESAVRSMEESGLFNAGRGACLTLRGQIELDAALMSGDGGGAGVGICTCTYHPVSLARFVMEATDHVLIAGEECKYYARKAGIRTERLKPSGGALRRFQGLRRRLGETHPKHMQFMDAPVDGNTVGAVAVDSGGMAAAAVSTGGMWLKLPGRIGDSAIMGAGVYADDTSGAASATGTGEDIIRAALSWNACSFMRDHDAMTAARMAISMISKRRGRNTAGIITIDRRGRTGFAYNTSAMGTAWFDTVKGRPVVRV